MSAASIGAMTGVLLIGLTAFGLSSGASRVSHHFPGLFWRELAVAARTAA